MVLTSVVRHGSAAFAPLERAATERETRPRRRRGARDRPKGRAEHAKARAKLHTAALDGANARYLALKPRAAAAVAAASAAHASLGRVQDDYRAAAARREATRDALEAEHARLVARYARLSAEAEAAAVAIARLRHCLTEV